MRKSLSCLLLFCLSVSATCCTAQPAPAETIPARTASGPNDTAPAFYRASVDTATATARVRRTRYQWVLRPNCYGPPVRVRVARQEIVACLFRAPRVSFDSVQISASFPKLQATGYAKSKQESSQGPSYLLSFQKEAASMMRLRQVAMLNAYYKSLDTMLMAKCDSANYSLLTAERRLDSGIRSLDAMKALSHRVVYQDLRAADLLANLLKARLQQQQNREALALARARLAAERERLLKAIKEGGATF